MAGRREALLLRRAPGSSIHQIVRSAAIEARAREREPVKDTFPGLQTLAVHDLPHLEMGKMRIVHEFMQYDTALARCSSWRRFGYRTGLGEGTPLPVDEEERAAYLEPTDDDGPAMLERCPMAGLQRTKDRFRTGRYDMPDWMFVQRLALKIFDHRQVRRREGVAGELEASVQHFHQRLCGVRQVHRGHGERVPRSAVSWREAS